MADTVNTPNMNLPNPVPSVAPSPEWAQDVSACFIAVDAHTHSPGSGVPVTPSGLNINADLPFGGNSGTQLLTTSYNSQGSALNAVSFPKAVYVAGGELYYNDAAGNQVQLTSGGSVNATSSGISSGTATASFVGGVLVINSNTNTPGDIQAGHYIMGDDTTDGQFVTIVPPAGLTSYTLTLPAPPASAQGLVQMSSSGIMTVSPSVDNVTLQFSGGQLSVKNAGITSAKIASATIKQSNMAILTPTIAGPTTFTTSSGSYVSTGLSTTITTTGGTVWVSFRDGAVGGDSSGGPHIDVSFAIYRNGVNFSSHNIVSFPNVAASANTIRVPSGGLAVIDGGIGAGTYTYTLYAKVNSASTTATVQGAFILATEL